ncbi:ATP-binding protein [Deinococcus sp. UR1]|uniref:ATP-binding protein n=1 Tax=Deinococcus sp. UR1 TaxID=1704277 RepID=UPI000C19A148|nr:ATP-binding protein [Deinococcus sp. UR1]PIG97339.1 hypothetical protein AMD26_013295 [Deinococcus sp. UR1]
MTASLSAALLWLLLAGAGVTALFASASARLNEAFGTDARILHRVLSQRMEQQEAVLNAAHALASQGVDEAALTTALTTLRRQYPQVVAAQRCSSGGCRTLGPADVPLPDLPAVTAPQAAVRWPAGGGPLYALSRGSVRVWVDARRLTDRLVEGSAPLAFTVTRPDTGAVLVSRATPPGAALRTFRVQKVLGTDLQAFPLEVTRAAPWRAWPWLGAAVWTVLTGGLTALITGLLRSRRAAQRALLDERALAAGVVQAATEAIVAVDDQHRVTLANPAARVALAHPLTPGTDLRAVTTFRATLSPAPFDADAFWANGDPTPLPDGLTLVQGAQATPVEGSLAPLRGARGEPRGRVLILREVGALHRRMLEQLEAGERRVREHQETLAHVSRLSTLSEMGAGLAHELNQPLTAIVSYSQAAARLLDEPEPDLGRVRHAVNASVHQAGRAAQIITRLREWVRRAPSQVRATDLVQAAQNVLTLCHADLRRLDIRVVTHVPPVASVQADPVHLEQIILNLLRNAIDALERTPDAQVTLVVEPEGGEWTLTVRDNGPGVAPEVLGRLFTPFTTSKDGGLGLGLSLSQTLAQGMGGDLHGANTTTGAAFQLRIPRAEPQPAGAGAAHPGGHP